MCLASGDRLTLTDVTVALAPDSTTDSPTAKRRLDIDSTLNALHEHSGTRRRRLARWGSTGPLCGDGCADTVSAGAATRRNRQCCGCCSNSYATLATVGRAAALTDFGTGQETNVNDKTRCRKTNADQRSPLAAALQRDCAWRGTSIWISRSNDNLAPDLRASGLVVGWECDAEPRWHKTGGLGGNSRRVRTVRRRRAFRQARLTHA
jgi:hypothetical protein